MRLRYLASLLVATTAAADVQFNLTMGDLRNQGGSQLLGTSALIQFVSLGPNGVFDPVPDGAWVGGDDALVNFSFGSSEWPSAAGFDLSEFDPLFPTDNGTPGQLIRTMSFGTLLTPGTRVGVRWFPAFTVTDFYNGAVTTNGTTYGEFTDTGWAFPSDGQIVDLQMITTSQGGPYANTVGFANFTVLGIPEVPSQWPGLFAAGALALTWRSRRARSGAAQRAT